MTTCTCLDASDNHYRHVAFGVIAHRINNDKQYRKGAADMVWKLPITGDVRTIKRFTILPTIIGNEVWWLETVVIHQSYNTQRHGWNNDWVERTTA